MGFVDWMSLQGNTLLENWEWGLDAIKFKTKQGLQATFPEIYPSSFSSRVWLLSTFPAEAAPVSQGVLFFFFGFVLFCLFVF